MSDSGDSSAPSAASATAAVAAAKADVAQSIPAEGADNTSPSSLLEEAIENGGGDGGGRDEGKDIATDDAKQQQDAGKKAKRTRDPAHRTTKTRHTDLAAVIRQAKANDRIQRYLDTEEDLPPLEHDVGGSVPDAFLGPYADVEISATPASRAFVRANPEATDIAKDKMYAVTHAYRLGQLQDREGLETKKMALACVFKKGLAKDLSARKCRFFWALTDVDLDDQSGGHDIFMRMIRDASEETIQLIYEIQARVVTRAQLQRLKARTEKKLQQLKGTPGEVSDVAPSVDEQVAEYAKENAPPSLVVPDVKTYRLLPIVQTALKVDMHDMSADARPRIMMPSTVGIAGSKTDTYTSDYTDVCDEQVDRFVNEVSAVVGDDISKITNPFAQDFVRRHYGDLLDTRMALCKPTSQTARDLIRKVVVLGGGSGGGQKRADTSPKTEPAAVPSRT